MNVKAIAYGGLLALWITASGCVEPGQVDPGAVFRYQRHLAQQGPEARQSDRGLGQLRPGEATSPKLDIVTGEDGRQIVRLSLDDAILMALFHNLEIRIASYEPSVSREDMVRAASEFDAIVQAGYSIANNDRLANRAFGLTDTQSEVREATVGVTQKLVTGGTWAATWTMNRTWDNESTARLRTRYEPTLNLTFSQPLLRNAWPEFNLANLRIARLNLKISEAQYRQIVEQTITEVVGAYWQLRQSRIDWDIQNRLLEETRNTYERVKDRETLDATNVQIKQAEAAVESRRASLIRAQKLIIDAQDALARLLFDPKVYLLASVEIVPITDPVESLVQFDEADLLLTALRHNPQLQALRYAVDVTELAVMRAENQTLPQLDLSVSTEVQGLDGSRHQAYETWGMFDYISTTVGLTFEHPVGNRLRKAELRQARFERLKAITQLQQGVDIVAQTVRERVREIQTTHQEYRAQLAVLSAARQQLQALNDTEKIRGRLTPEFLQLKLSAQETVANAERSLTQARISYNNALVQLAQTTGTVTGLTSVKISLPAASGDIDQLPDLGLPRAPIPPAVAPDVRDAPKPATQPGAGKKGMGVMWRPTTQPGQSFAPPPAPAPTEDRQP